MLAARAEASAAQATAAEADLLDAERQVTSLRVDLETAERVIARLQTRPHAAVEAAQPPDAIGALGTLAAQAQEAALLRAELADARHTIAVLESLVNTLRTQRSQLRRELRARESLAEAERRVADEQACVERVLMPGGWRLSGATELRSQALRQLVQAADAVGPDAPSMANVASSLAALDASIAAIGARSSPRSRVS